MRGSARLAKHIKHWPFALSVSKGLISTAAINAPPVAARERVHFPFTFCALGTNLRRDALPLGIAISMYRDLKC